MANIKRTAKEFWKAVDNATVLAFHGNMGAGKTTFIHALCEVKNVRDAVTSPTFSIINEYLFVENGSTKRIYHIDLYRIKDAGEALQAGIEDCLYSGEICLAEWPEKAPSLFPDNTMHIYIEVIDAQNRCIRIGDK